MYLRIFSIKLYSFLLVFASQLNITSSNSLIFTHFFVLIVVFYMLYVFYLGLSLLLNSSLLFILFFKLTTCEGVVSLSLFNPIINSLIFTHFFTHYLKCLLEFVFFLVIFWDFCGCYAHINRAF